MPEEVFKYVCDECGYEFYAPTDEVDFCPHCGSKDISLLLPGIDVGIFCVEEQEYEEGGCE